MGLTGVELFAIKRFGQQAYLCACGQRPLSQWKAISLLQHHLLLRGKAQPVTHPLHPHTMLLAGQR